ncbi:MAG: CotH kinase family protein, partial [Myxococcales bacterium]|nr:CotH kinase family protein [Myxococcales bacterium]
MTHAPPRLTTAGRIVLLGLLALAAAACDDESAKSGVDLGPEVAADAGGDGMRAQFGDAARDASSDAMMDATVDGIDAMVDGGAEKAFDPARLIEVRVEIAPADWDALRVEGRSWGEVLRPDCQDAPSPSPYHWYHGTVTVDGEVFGDVAVRKKGFLGSLSATRPSLKIKLDEYVPDQAFRGLDRLTLNNGRQDPSAIRTCLAYSMFARAGVPTPRCSMAHVTVNGVDLGVYAHVEAVKKPFLRAHFNDDEGWLYEGNLSDFRDGWTDTFEQKTREDVPYRAPLDRVVAALDAPDETLFAALDAVLDLDAFFTFWATEVLIAHWDGYAGDLNNFLVYADAETERLRFIPWGPDAAFEPPRLLTEGVPAPRSVFAVGALARRLYLHPEGRARFLARLRTLHDTLWDVPGLQAEAEAWGAVAAQAVPEAARARHAIAVAEVGAFIAEQDAAVTADLDAGGVDWVLPLRGPICVQPAGDA